MSKKTDVQVVKERYIHPIETDLRTIYAKFHECLYDVLKSDPNDEHADLAKEMAIAINSPTTMLRMFNDGYTCLLVPHLMEKIEGFTQNEQLYMIIILNNGEIWTTVGCNQVNY